MKPEQSRKLWRSLMVIGALVAWVALALIITFIVRAPSPSVSDRSASARLPQVSDPVSVAGTNGMMQGGRAILIGAKLERIDPALLRSWSRLSPEALQALRLEGVRTVPFIDNVDAMRRYQEAWDAYKASGDRVIPPSLYPSPLQRIMERAR